MWKKNETAKPSSTPKTITSDSPRAVHASPSTPISAASRSDADVAAIGPSLTVKGEVLGNEDLLIEGAVEGRVSIRRHRVTVGESGRVKADIEAANIRVAGEVRGNLTASEQVILLASGRVEGDIKAGNVTLENGARFKGSIDMETQAKSAGETSAKDRSVASPSTPSANAKPNGTTAGTSPNTPVASRT